MRLTYIELKEGERHPMCFSLSATERIVDEFGGLDEMTQAITQEGDLVGKIRAINTMLEILLDAGRRYCGEMGIEMPPKIKCRPGDLIDITDGAAIGKIFETMQNDSHREVEAKNAGPTPEG